jgi:prepilin-type N-terminal cleavage/methylation domain-containing protein
MRSVQRKRNAGFSLIELMITMVVVVLMLGIVSTLLSRSLSVRARESRKTDALTSAQAALNIMSREIANSGFGIYDGVDSQTAVNGIILGGDSTANQIHFRANLSNAGDGPVNPTCPAVCTNEPGEDVTYFFDDATDSIVRYDPNGSPTTSVIVNKISNVTFSYFDYAPDGTSTAEPGNATPTIATGRIRLTVDVQLDEVQGQPAESVRFTSEINLRNSSYMLRQY